MSQKNSKIIYPSLDLISQCEPTLSPKYKKSLVCCWKPKTWTLIFAGFQIVICALSLALYMTQYEKKGDWIFGNENNQFITNRVLLIGFLSNGIFWGSLLFLGAQCESTCLLGLWLMVEVLTIVSLIVAGIVFRAEVALLFSYFLSLSWSRPTVALSAMIILTGALLGVCRFNLVILTCRQYQSL